MLILKICLIYMLVGALFGMLTFYVILKCKPDGYEDFIQEWNDNPILCKFGILTALALCWPRIACMIIHWAYRLITEHRIHIEFKRRKRNES